MLKKLFAFLPDYPSDENYYRFEQELSYKNAQHIYTLTLLIALAGLTLLAYPFGGYLLDATAPPLSAATLLAFSGTGLLVVFMLLHRYYAGRLRRNSAVSNRRRLVMSFSLSLLAPAAIISLYQHTPDAVISSFLVSTCLLMVALYWPLNRLLLGSYLAILGYFFLIYLIEGSFQPEPPFLLVHLVFPILFYILARHINALKFRDLESMSRIEAQAQALRHNNRVMLQQRHTLESSNKYTRDSLFKIGKERGLLYANDALAIVLGYQHAGQLLAQENKHVFFSNEQLQVISRKVNQQGFAQGLEFKIHGVHGQAFWVEVSCMVYPDENTGELLFEGNLSDISFRKKALREAHINATRLEQAESVAGTGFFELELSNGKITLSKGCASLMKAQPEQPYSLNDFLEFIHAKDRDLLRQQLLEAMAQYQGFTLTFQLNLPTETYLSCKAAMVSDATEKGLRLLATVQDITEVEVQASLLARSEAYIRAAFQHNHFGILLYSSEEKILEFNQALQHYYKRLFGAKLSENIGLQQALSEKDYQHLAPLLASTLEGHFHKVEYCFSEQTNISLWAELNFSPVIAPNGQIIGGLLMISDVSERKSGEQLIETLSHLASDSGSPMVLTDAEGLIEWANVAFCTLSGVSQQELQKLRLDEFLQIGEDEHLLSVQLATTYRYRGEGIIRKNTENTTRVYLTTNPLHINQSGIGKFVWVLTEIESATAQLKTQQSALEKAKTKLSHQEAFLSAISHELRTPLNAVIGMAHHLAESNPRPDQAEDLEVLRFSAEHLLTLINDILDMSKLEAGKVTIHQAPFNLREVLSSLKKAFQPQAAEKQLQFKMMLRDEVPEWLVGDRQRFIQIVTNLLNNAFKFTEKGSVRLTIQAVPYEPGRCCIEVTVTDTGIGIAPDQLPRVFDRYEQLNSNLPREASTGLGLAITKQLLELQGGRISAESQEGKGSTFRFAIPFGIAANPATEASQQEEAVAEEQLSGMKVLLVEDNIINQKVAGKFLTNWGVAFDTAENGLIALEKAKQTRYHLVLMDLQMPVMDGFEATRQLRQLDAYREVPIIALTAAGNPGSKPEMQQMGLTDVVFKPFQPEELFMHLKRCKVAVQPEALFNMPNDKLTITALDLTDVLEIASNDQAFLNELLGLYVQQFTEVIPQINAGIKSFDILGLRRILHKIKPSLILLRQPSLHDVAQHAHDRLHEKQLTAVQLEADFRPLVAGFTNLLGLLETACEKHVKTA